MAAPTPTARGTPGGIPLQEGHGTLITLALNDTIKFWEKETAAPGMEGGDPINTSTNHNETWETMVPRALITLTPFTVRCAYDPDVYSDDQVQAAINRRDTITVTFQDTSTLAFFGYLKSFTPAGMNKEGQPEADVEFVPTNWDHANNVEAGPAMAEAAGT